MKNMTKQEKFNLISFIVAVIITSVVMIVFIGQKNGWHEDEIFSYGSSNCTYDNLFQRFGTKDSLNQLVDEKIIGENPVETIKNIGYYVSHKDEFKTALDEKVKNETPIWKTPEEAKDYLTVSSDEIFSYWSVYYNQARDVHPPLFYMIVHLASSFCLGHFSKYIIFAVNLVFYVASCCIIRKILRLFNKDNLSGVTVLLYGLSMGAISIVMFQRMYMILTFFILAYLYLNIKIFKNSFEIDKKTKRWLVLTIILGFLTQYYFCIYAVFLAITAMLIMIKKKEYIALKQYIWCHIKAAIIGIIIFPASIYHIFFSYRGAAGGVVDTSYLDRLKEYLNLIFYAFSVPEVLGYIIIAILAVLLIFKLIKGKHKDIILIISVPVILFILTIAKIAPFINIRYVSPVLAIIVIAVELIILSIINHILKYVIKTNPKETKLYNFLNNYAGIIVITVITIGVSTYGFLNSEPQFLYTDYLKRVEIAENYKNLKLVYVGESPFNHLQDIEEFLRYKNTLIANTWELEVLKDNEGLKNEDEFILNIKCWVSNFDENLNKVLKYTNAKSYELLIDDGQSRVYKVQK